MTMTQTTADALAALLGWGGAPDMPVAERDEAHAQLSAAGIIEWDAQYSEWFIIDPMAVAEEIMAGMDRGELAR
jgi:hypothetical protein